VWCVRQLEPHPTRPTATIESEGPLKTRDVGLDPGSKVPEHPVNPGAFDHLLYEHSFPFGKRDVL